MVQKRNQKERNQKEIKFMVQLRTQSIQVNRSDSFKRFVGLFHWTVLYFDRIIYFAASFPNFN